MGNNLPSFHSDGGSFVPTTPDIARALCAYELRKGDHVQRYMFASSVIGSGSVLDLGCGHGFGAFYLSKKGRSYLGVDSDAAAVGWASQSVSIGLPSAKFALADTFDREDHTDQFDAIVLLEVIEHVKHPRLLLERCRTMLRTRGRLVLSTPNGFLSEGSPRLHQSRYHVKEFNSREVAQMLLESGFSADLYKQHRLDHLDSLPQLAKRVYLGIPHVPDNAEVDQLPSAQSQSDGESMAKLTLPYRIFQAIPAWRTLWRTQPLTMGRGSPWSYSHIVAVASPQLEPPETD